MPVAKTIFVTGATGNQGGAVVRNLLKSGFHVKALTRNASSAKAKQLKELNAEPIEGDLDDPSSYSHHLKGVEGVFGLNVYTKGTKREIQRGITLTDSAKENKVRHFLYSSVIGADLHTGIPHWESKFRIENHIKESGLPYTIIRPASLYENFLIPQVKSRLLKGKLVTPVHKNKMQQYICSEDIGKISTAIFLDPGKYIGKTIGIAALAMDGIQVSGIFSKVWGKEVTYQQLPGFITRLAMGKDLSKMFTWINNNDAVLVKDMEARRNEFPGMLSLEEWIQGHFK